MGRGKEIKSAAIEEDYGAVVEGVTKAAGIGLEGLDFGVEALGHRVGLGAKIEVEKFEVKYFAQKMSCWRLIM
jgi:hypothetical protein